MTGSHGKYVIALVMRERINSLYLDGMLKRRSAGRRRFRECTGASRRTLRDLENYSHVRTLSAEWQEAGFSIYNKSARLDVCISIVRENILARGIKSQDRAPPNEY